MSIFAAPSFYNQADQNIYGQGYSFIPQERFRGGAFNFPTTEDENTGSGIQSLPVTTALNNRNNNVFSGSTSDLTTAFQKAVDDRQNRLTELNRPLNPGTFNVTSNLTGRGRLDPMGSGYYDTLNRLEARDPSGYRMSTFNENFAPSGEVVSSIDYDPRTNPNIKKAFFESVYQSGPQVFDAEEPTIGRKISDAFYSIPGLSKPQSAEDILTSGYNQPYGVGGPGIIGAILGKMDNYHNLSRPEQAFISANMGYTGPTVFGENTTGLSKDPFGLNVRSAFGNYAERVGVESEKLGDLLSKDLAEKYGVEFDEETGMFVGANAKKANDMTKMLRAKYNFYTQQNMNYADMVKKNAELAAKRDKDLINELGITADDAFSTTTQGGGGGIADSGYGRGGGLDASKMGGGSQQAKSGGQKAGGTGRTDGGWGLADGGRVPYMMGGLTNLVDIYD